MEEPSYEEWRAGLLKRNLPFAKKGSYVTSLGSDQEETKFQEWVAKNKVPIQIDDPRPDYDMRGYYKELMSGGKDRTEINPVDNKLHFPDTYKTPYHESFSNESMYATKDAPSWQGDDKTGWKLIGKDGTVYKDETIPQESK